MGDNKALLVGVGGALVSTALGVGPAPGFILGSTVGGRLFPPPGTTTEGPRLSDLTVSSAAYGANVPVGFGGPRQPGVMIWSTDLIPRITKHKVGGKGGAPPSNTSITETYFASFAIAFGEGPANAVLRIWADSKLIYDGLTAQGIDPHNRYSFDGTTISKVTTNVSNFTNAQDAGINFRFYPGDDEQLPDTLMSAIDGASVTPAYRKTCYIVFDDFPLTNFGNRIPSITAEIAYAGEDSRGVVLATQLSGAPLENTHDTTAVAVDLDRGFAYIRDVVGTAAQKGLRKINLRTMAEVQQITSDNMGDAVDDPVASVSNAMCVTPSGDLIIVGGLSNTRPIYRIDPNSLMILNKFGLDGAGTGNRTDNFEATIDMTTTTVLSSFGRRDFILCKSIFNSVGILDATDLSMIWSSDVFISGIQQSQLPEDRIKGISRGATRTDFAEFFFIAGNAYSVASSADLVLYRVKVSPQAKFSLEGTIEIFLGTDLEIIRTFTPSDFFGSETTLNNSGLAMAYDEVDDSLIFFVSPGSNTTDHHLVKVNKETGVITWTTVALADQPIGHTMNNQNRLRNSVYGFVASDDGYEIDLTDGSLKVTDFDFSALGSSQAAATPGVYDSYSRSFIGTGSLAAQPLIRFMFDRSDANVAFVDDIIKSIALRVGIPNADIVATSVNTLFVGGYIINSQMSARAAIAPLMRFFLFDAVESGFKLKFVARGQAPIRTIAYDGLLADDSPTSETLTQTRTKDINIPREVVITYREAENDHQEGSQSAQRSAAPLRSMQSSQRENMQFAASIPAVMAKQQAEKILYTKWSERTSRGTQLAWDHLDLDPTDVVNITDRDGQTLRVRLTEASIGDDLTTSIVGIQEVENQLVSTINGSKGEGHQTQSISESVFLELVLLDVPLLRDADEPPSRAFLPHYALAGSVGGSGFQRGTVLKSSDNNEFSVLSSITSEMDWGVCVNALGDPPDGKVFQTDNVNTLTFQMVNGGESLASVTQAQLFSGSNSAALLKSNGEVEFIGFQNVVVNVDGSITADTFVRGLRGTDTMAFSHGTGEKIIMLIAVDIQPFSLTLTERNATRFYKALSPGQFEDQVLSENFTSLGRALMPYAPFKATAAAGGSNSIDFTWKRRARIGAKFTASLPLSEDSEAYEIDFLDGPAGTVVGTTAATDLDDSITTNAYNYSSADQTTHGFSPPLSQITVKIYQISAQVGRGFAKEVTLDVE